MKSAERIRARLPVRLDHPIRGGSLADLSSLIDALGAEFDEVREILSGPVADALIRRAIEAEPPRCPACRGILRGLTPEALDETGSFWHCPCGVKVSKGDEGEAMEWLRAVLNATQGTVTADLDHTLREARKFAGLP